MNKFEGFQPSNTQHIIDQAKSMGFPSESTYNLHYLALSLINSHCECQANWKLQRFE